MQKILIVGGAGYIGGYMTDIFVKNGDFDVTIYDNLLYETRFLKTVKFIYGDIRDRALLGSIIHDYDIVVWLAAIVGDGACAVDVRLSEELNFNSVKWLVDNYKGKIVFTSTCSVYGINNDLIDEDAEPNPLSVYALTKLTAERYIVKNAKDYLIFRLGTLYGLSDEHSRIRLDLVVNILTMRAVMGEALTVFGGEQWRPILHVRDVAHAIDYCLKNKVTGLYNLSEQNIIIADLAKEIKNHIPEVEVVYEDMKFEDLRNYRVRNDRITATGWKPMFHLGEGIEEMKRVIGEGRIKDTNDPVYSNVAFLKHSFTGGKNG